MRGHSTFRILRKKAVKAFISAASRPRSAAFMSHTIQNNYTFSAAVGVKKKSFRNIKKGRGDFGAVRSA